MAKSTKAWTTAAIAAALLAVIVLAGMYLRPKEQADYQYVAREQSFRYENESVYAVFAPAEGTYELSIEGQCPSGLALQVNGLPADGGIGAEVQVALHKGINSISIIDEADGITGIRLKDCPTHPDYGAFTAYTTYEAENGETNAIISDDIRDYRVFSSEASGRRYVALEDPNDYVTVKLSQPADALVIRYCIPDSEDGTGLSGTVDLLINGVRQDLPLTSKNCWVYGRFPWTNDPSTNDGHFFYDDVRVKLNQIYPEGTEITVRKGEMFEYCLIDLIEGEVMPAPIPMPDNALSIEEFGAKPDDGEDDSWALINCIAAAVEQGKEVYIPAGEFEIIEHPYTQGIPLRQDNITIRGAGMWHTILNGTSAGFAVEAANISLYDFSMIGNVVQRYDGIDPACLNLQESIPGVKNIRVQNLWIEHYKVGMWAQIVYNISVMGCRFRNTYADGINLCAGTSYCVLTQNDFRNTGDDGIAMWSKGIVDEENKVTYNTIAIPWLANNIALYGGKNIEISHNLLKDTVCNGGGVNISTAFVPQEFEGTILIENNGLIRCGSRENNIGVNYGAVWVNLIDGYDNISADAIIVRNNLIEDSSYQAISFSNGARIENMEIIGNTIAGCGTYALEVLPESKGSVTFKDNKITDAGEIKNHADSAFTIIK